MVNLVCNPYPQTFSRAPGKKGHLCHRPAAGKAGPLHQSLCAGASAEGLRCTRVAKAQGNPTGTAGDWVSKGSGERQVPKHLLRIGLEKGGLEGEASPPTVAPL